ncbi:DUF3413 domain-containing protein [Photobacterium damselae]|uniref:DUF3413 domain-containing protein n=1 Tax=Photobacterium damselae TaxID=38293 RepID=UPI001EDCFEF6|nr:DUF3413 domain-containing protein [Photobacterium damselae]MCG3810652.1 DUF3413 domain-containing protein [Photobacterium damselae]
MVTSGTQYKDKVSQLISWGHWFSFFNIIAAMLLGTRYIIHSEWPETILGQLYLVLSWVGHFGFLVFAIYILILFPASFIIPSQRVMRFFGVLIATVGFTALLLDTHAYQTVDLHLSPLVWDLLLSGEKTDLNTSWQYLFVVVPVFFLFELVLSETIWRKLRKLSRKRVGGPIALIFGLSFLSSHLLYIWADANLYHPITMQRSNFPLSYPMTAKSFMEKHGLLDRQEYKKRQEKQGVDESDQIRYPIEKLNYSDQGTNQNILFIMIDGLRSDMVNAETMPYLSRFAQNNLDYTNHYSTGNNNRNGIFGLFYGLPGSYSNSMQLAKKQPILLNTLADRGYDFGLFSGDDFNSPIYQDLLFTPQEIDASKTAKERSEKPSDHLAIAEWDQWLTTETDKPWFSYIELTAVQDFEEGGSYVAKFSPSIGSKLKHNQNVDSTLLLRNSYRNAAFHVDQQLEKILTLLKEKELLNNTIVIITANHGTEFNETGSNTWGADTNFSQYQIKVPLIIHWPEHSAQQISRITSHLDIVPTIMESVLHVASAPSNYSSGVSLFESDPSRRWILAGDDKNIVVVRQNNTTVVDKYGNYRVYDPNYQLKEEGKPKLSTLMQVMHELKRFYQPNNN